MLKVTLSILHSRLLTPHDFLSIRGTPDLQPVRRVRALGKSFQSVHSRDTSKLAHFLKPLRYLIRRGVNIGDEMKDGEMGQPIDLAKVLGRSRKRCGAEDPKELVELFHGAEESDRAKEQKKIREGWAGSGHGHEWDERVGAGVAANSITGRLVFAGWKLVQEEVKHPNASYLPAIVSSVLGLRIPYHDYMYTTRMYGQDRGRERWRVFHHLLVQATATLMLFDALDVIGRAGEAARLSGVEFADSFPGIRGSQYKVEGVLLRALKSLNSNERGSKKGRRIQNSTEISQSNSTQSDPRSPWKRRRHPGHENDSISYPDGSYFFYSPSKEDADRQEALEVQALTLEVNFYTVTMLQVLSFFLLTQSVHSLNLAIMKIQSLCAISLLYILRW